jgi:hypothetical protein
VNLNQEDSQDQDRPLPVNDTKKVARPFSDWASSFFKIVEVSELPGVKADHGKAHAMKVGEFPVSATASGARPDAAEPDFLKPDLSLPSYFEPPIKDPPSGYTLGGFLAKHDQTLFWIAFAISMAILAYWFLDTHGYFELSNATLNRGMYDASRFAPVAGIWMLFSRSLHKETPWLAALTFVSIIFYWPIAAFTAVVVLVSRFKGFSRGLCLCTLIFVQLIASSLVTQHRPLRIEDSWNTGTHRIALYRTTEPVNYFTSVEHLLREEIAVTPWFKFVKVHCRIFDRHVPADASIIPVDAEHVTILINRHSHYERTFVDLSRKNKPIVRQYFER